MSFKDYFSEQAASYASSRPDYPDALYQFLLTQVSETTLCWDVATGNGQAAVALASHFERVVATDASNQQLQQAVARPNIEYRCEPAEHSSLDNACVDLVTVAQALHWFDFDAFYTEVKRVLKPTGVIVVWSYGLLSVNAEIDPLIESFYSTTLGPYWPPERRYVDEGYRTIPFPFVEREQPRWMIVREWSLQQFCEYLASWSALQKYSAQSGDQVIEQIKKQLQPYWKKNLQVSWPVAMRIGTRV